MGIASIISLFASVALQALSSYGVISAPTQNLVSGLATGVANLIPQLLSGQSKVQDAISVLAGISAMLTTLMADPALPADKLAQLKMLDGDVQAGVQGYLTASKGYDPANYAPISLVS